MLVEPSIPVIQLVENGNTCESYTKSPHPFTNSEPQSPISNMEDCVSQDQQGIGDRFRSLIMCMTA